MGTPAKAGAGQSGDRPGNGDEARSRRSSGVYRVVDPPAATLDVADVRRPDTPGALRRSSVPEQRVVLDIDRDSSLGSVLRRMLGGSAAVLVMLAASPEMVNRDDRSGKLTVELRAVPMEVPGVSPAANLFEVREVSGEMGLYVGERQVRFRGNGQLLLQHLLNSPGMSAPNNDVEQLIWPNEKGDLGARRRELASRVNAKLKRKLGLGPGETPGVPLPIESFEHTTRLNPAACRLVADKSLTQV